MEDSQENLGTYLDQSSFHLVVDNYINVIKKYATPIQLDGLDNSIEIKKEDINLFHAPITDDLGIPVKLPDFIFETGKFALNSTVISKCWKHRDIVNQFYLNLLSCFVYIYLDPSSSMSIEDQIKYLQDLLENDQEACTKILLSNCHNTLSNIKKSNQEEETNSVVVTNAANGKYLGGVSTYGEGSAEEALCRQSDLFLRMLLENAKGDYQKNILRKLLEVFHGMITNDNLPITDKESAEVLANELTAIIIKSSFEGYCIYFGANEIGNRVHWNKNIVLTDSENLPLISSLREIDQQERIHFLNRCVFNIDILSIAARDNRWIGTDPFSFFPKQGSNFAQLSEDIFSICGEISNQKEKPVNLVVLPLGCGAFGNKLSDFASSFKKALMEITHLGTKIKQIYLTTFFDNYSGLVECFDKEPLGNISYTNIGKPCRSLNGIQLNVKLKGIQTYPQMPNQMDPEKAIVISISTTRNTLPSSINNLMSKSALSTICKEVEKRTGEIEAFKNDFEEGAKTGTIFESLTVGQCFDRKVYFQPIPKKSNGASLEEFYRNTLLHLDEAGIKSVDLTLFGTFSGGYTIKESCEALMSACAKLELHNLNTITFLTNSLDEVKKVSCVLEVNNDNLNLDEKIIFNNV